MIFQYFSKQHYMGIVHIHAPKAPKGKASFCLYTIPNKTDSPTHHKCFLPRDIFLDMPPSFIILLLHLQTLFDSYQ